MRPCAAARPRAVCCCAVSAAPQGAPAPPNPWVPAAPRPRALQHRARFSSVACGSTASPNAVAWLDSVEFGLGYGADSILDHHGPRGRSSHAGNGAGAGAHAAGPESRLRGARAVSALQRQQFDAVVMLAGGLTPDGGLPEWVTRRLDTAHDVQLLQQRSCPVLFLGGGTPHKPAILGPTGHVLHESTSCADYVIGRGASPGDLLKETSSFDTVGNAYFALTIHAIPAAWRRVAVVTSAFHMPRSKALFDVIWRLAGESVYGDPDRFQLVYASSSDHGVFDDYVYQARLEKEAEAVANWNKASSHFKTLADFHAWFYSDHLCYAVPKQHLFGARTIQDERLLASY